MDNAQWLTAVVTVSWCKLIRCIIEKGISDAFKEQLMVGGMYVHDTEIAML